MEEAICERHARALDKSQETKFDASCFLQERSKESNRFKQYIVVRLIGLHGMCLYSQVRL